MVQDMAVQVAMELQVISSATLSLCLVSYVFYVFSVFSSFILVVCF